MKRFNSRVEIVKQNEVIEKLTRELESLKRNNEYRWSDNYDKAQQLSVQRDEMRNLFIETNNLNNRLKSLEGYLKKQNPKEYGKWKGMIID